MSAQELLAALKAQKVAVTELFKELNPKEGPGDWGIINDGLVQGNKAIIAAEALANPKPGINVQLPQDITVDLSGSNAQEFADQYNIDLDDPDNHGTSFHYNETSKS